MDVNLTLIAGHHDTSDQRQLGSRLLDSGRTSCDGYIVMGLGARRCSALIDQLQGEDVPIVVLSRQWPDVMVSTVSQDHRQQIKLVMDYLMRLGHRRIAFVAREEDRYYDWFEWRLEAFRQAMAQLNGGMDDDLVSVGADGAVAVRTVLERCPDVTAVFGVNDGRAVEAMQGLSALGLRIPHDVSVIGVDDTTRPPAPFPPLTTVTYPHAEMGFLAAELLLKQIENRSILCTNMVVRSHLVERASCARARS